MEWKNGTLRSMLKGNKEKVIFLFCSGLLLFVISLPNGKTTDSGLRAGTVEVIADVSGDDVRDEFFKRFIAEAFEHFPAFFPLGADMPAGKV